MFAGFDYGTSHCSIGLPQASGVRLVPLEDGDPFIPSALFAPRPRHQLDGEQIAFTPETLNALKFGRQALNEYLDDPTEGYFVKSPKSFLGAAGLSESIKSRFIIVVAAMMANVKRHAERVAGESVDQVIIGRPVNFQTAGDGSDNRALDQANQQALTMLAGAAREAGFEEVGFLYEPLAAALEYEDKLVDERRVLVIDIGGGTTDCSFVVVGPERKASTRRSADLLGHAGERIGGNDYDQQLGLRTLMPHFGYGAVMGDGLPVPSNYFVDAISTNNVAAQQRFYSRHMQERLDACQRAGVDAVGHLLRVRESRLTYRLAQSAEALKIRLSNAASAKSDLSYVAPGLVATGAREDLAQSCERLLDHLHALVSRVLTQAGTSPDVAYLTGGMSRASVVRAFLREMLPGVELVDSDHFASVTQGLALWAKRMFGERTAKASWGIPHETGSARRRQSQPANGTIGHPEQPRSGQQ